MSNVNPGSPSPEIRALLAKLRLRVRAYVWVEGISLAVVGLMALGAESDFDDAVVRSNDTSLPASARRNASAQGRASADDADTLALTSDILLAGAVVAAGAAVVIVLLADDSDDSSAPALSLSPSISPLHAGAMMRGSF